MVDLRFLLFFVVCFVVVKTTITNKCSNFETITLSDAKIWTKNKNDRFKGQRDTKNKQNVFMKRANTGVIVMEFLIVYFTGLHIINANGLDLAWGRILR